MKSKIAFVSCLFLSGIYRVLLWLYAIKNCVVNILLRDLGFRTVLSAVNGSDSPQKN